MQKNTTNTKKSKKNNREFIIALLLLVALLAAIAFFAFVFPKLTTKQMPQNEASMPYDVPGFTMLDELPGTDLDNGLSVLCVGKYSGIYYEDGTDEQVKDVLSIVVCNNGDSLVEYANIDFEVGGKTASFTLSGLPVGSAVLVQEKNRMTWENQRCGSFTCTEFARPASVILDFGNDFELYLDDGVINAKNISGADITSDVKVFYKNFEYGLFMGGITYSAKISGGIKAEQIGQCLTNHYWQDTSAVLYMSYAK